MRNRLSTPFGLGPSGRFNPRGRPSKTRIREQSQNPRTKHLRGFTAVSSAALIARRVLNHLIFGTVAGGVQDARIAVCPESLRPPDIVRLGKHDRVGWEHHSLASKLLGMDELTMRVLKLFIEMDSESLDLHTLFEAGGNDPHARKLVLDVVTRLVDTGLLESKGGDYYSLTDKGHSALRTR